MRGSSGPLVRWVLIAQLALTSIAAMVTAPVAGFTAAGFVMLGGATAMALGLLFALRLFAVDAESDPQGALSALYRGAAAKLVGAVIVFTAAARWMPHHVVELIIGFAAATISYWIALLRAPLGPPAEHKEGR